MNLQEIKARAEAAGMAHKSWHASIHVDDGDVVVGHPETEDEFSAVAIVTDCFVEHEENQARASHIAQMDPATTLALIAEVERLREENTRLKKALTADAFWDANDPERMYGSPEEIAQDIWGYGIGTAPETILFETQEAAILPSRKYVAEIPADYADTHELKITQVTDEQYAGACVAIVVADFARTALEEAQTDD